MKLHNLERAHDLDIKNWLINKIPGITPYQKQTISDPDFLRSSSFYVFKRKKSSTNIWWRFTVVFFPIVVVLIFLTLPFKYVITGTWGYSYYSLKWFNNWKYKLGL